jgi:hypothetical protein
MVIIHAIQYNYGECFPQVESKMKALFGPECSALARLTALRQYVVKLPEETLTTYPQLMYTFYDFPEQHATAGDEELTTLDIGRGRHSLPTPRSASEGRQRLCPRAP